MNSRRLFFSFSFESFSCCKTLGSVENIVDAPMRVFGYAIVCKPKLVCFVCTVDLTITHVIFGISRFARDHWNAVK